MTRLAEFAMVTTSNFLKANLNTEITTVAATYSDGIPMPLIGTANFYYGWKHNLPEFPSCVVYHPPDLSELAGGGYGNTWAQVTHKIIVQIATVSELEGNLNHATLRYGEAIFNVLYKNQNLGAAGNTTSSIISVVPRRAARSAPEKHKNQTLLQAVGWLCEITVQEQY